MSLLHNTLYPEKRSSKAILVFLLAIIVFFFIFLFNIPRDLADEPKETSVEQIDYHQPAELTARLPSNEDMTPGEQTTNPLLIVDNVSKPLTSTTSIINSTTSILLDVPFTPQAPFGNWSEPRQDYGCEEASVLMVWHYLTGKPLTYQLALEEITAMSDWELETYGEFRDSSAADTLKRFQEYFGSEQGVVTYDIKLEHIKKELLMGNPVIVPVDGQLLDNPYYTPPGPLHHMLVVIGFDDETNELITNDPGTRRGEGLQYDYDNFMLAARDYDTGHGEPVLTERSAMIVIGL